MSFLINNKNKIPFISILTFISLSSIGCSQSHSVQTISSHVSPSQKLAVSLSHETGKNLKINDKLNLYLQLLQTNDFSATTYADFITNNPTWPNQNVLLDLMQKQLLNETDKNAISNICKTQPIKKASALKFCAQQTEMKPELIQKARSAWIFSINLPADEQNILPAYNQYFTKQDNWNRFDRLENAGLTLAASRQVKYLTSEQSNLALARLAFRKKQQDAENYLSKLSKSDLNDTSLIYNRLRWLRLQNRQEEALKYWRFTGLNEELKSNQKRFWFERNNLIREFLKNNNIKQAASLITDASCNPSSCQQDEIFLGGWIQLRKLNNALKSIDYFKKLIQSNNISIKSRGYYWLGRAYQANNNNDEANQAWRAASKYPVTFYGQLSIAQLHHLNVQNLLLNPNSLQKILQTYLTNIKEASSSNSQYIFFKNNELIQAARILVEQGYYNHARPFLAAYNKLHFDIANQIINANYANQIHLPDNAVTISRQAAAKGYIFLKNGWPRPYASLANEGLPSGLSLAIMRQESSFNPVIVSHAHAYGLMQLLPSTARELCHQNKIPLNMGNPGNLIVADNNIRLGIAYLAKLMKRFNNNLIFTIASYNAGPNRVKNWLNSSENNSVQTYTDMIDWIEMIPYTETRNYVQHVMENLMIYQTNINK